MPDWTRGDLVSRLQGHGFHYKDVTMLRDWIQESIDELIEEHTWPWALVEETITAPQTIGGLGSIEQVYLGSDGTQLVPSKLSDLRGRYGLLTDAGTPSYYWKMSGQIGVYPLYTDPVVVAHYTTYGWVGVDGNRKPAATDETDKPLVPSQNRDLVLLLARQRGKSEAQDHDEAAAIRSQYETRLEEIRSGREQVDELRRVRVTSTEDWA